MRREWKAMAQQKQVSESLWTSWSPQELQLFAGRWGLAAA